MKYTKKFKKGGKSPKEIMEEAIEKEGKKKAKEPVSAQTMIEIANMIDKPNYGAPTPSKSSTTWVYNNKTGGFDPDYSDMTFGQAFADARKRGLDKFQYKDKGWFTTETEEEALAKKAEAEKKKKESETKTEAKPKEQQEPGIDAELEEVVFENPVDSTSVRTDSISLNPRDSISMRRDSIGTDSLRNDTTYIHPRALDDVVITAPRTYVQQPSEDKFTPEYLQGDDLTGRDLLYKSSIVRARVRKAKKLGYLEQGGTIPKFEDGGYTEKRTLQDRFRGYSGKYHINGRSTQYKYGKKDRKGNRDETRLIHNNGNTSVMEIRHKYPWFGKARVDTLYKTPRYHEDPKIFSFTPQDIRDHKRNTIGMEHYNTNFNSEYYFPHLKGQSLIPTKFQQGGVIGGEEELVMDFISRFSQAAGVSPETPEGEQIVGQAVQLFTQSPELVQAYPQNPDGVIENILNVFQQPQQVEMARKGAKLEMLRKYK